MCENFHVRYFKFVFNYLTTISHPYWRCTIKATLPLFRGLLYDIANQWRVSLLLDSELVHALNDLTKSTNLP